MNSKTEHEKIPTGTRKLQDLVLECAKKHPHQIAVLYDNGTDVKEAQSRSTLSLISYSELSQQVIQLKLTFTLLEVTGQVIGVLLTDCTEIPSILLGILSSLCAFHPINVESLFYSSDALKRAGVSWILVHTVLLQKILPLIQLLKGREVQSDVLDKFGLKFFCLCANSSQSLVARYELAYSITTSGTTSSPKVVQVPHACIVPNILDLSKSFQLGVNDKVLLTSPLTFDPSIIDIFCTLSSGACLVIVPSELKKRPEKLLEIIHTRQAVTVLQATPTLLQSFSSSRLCQTILGPDSSLRILAFGGEKFPSAKDLRLWLHPNNKVTEFFNLYGITEVSCWATCHPVDVEALLERDEPVPIGRALDKTLIQVVHHEVDDKNTNADEGDIWIGSSHRICIINDEGESGKGERNSSVYENGKDKIVWRNSGDQGKLMPDGNIIYLGRNDDQVKRHGKRLNLSAIEMVCRGLPCVLNCCALLNNGNIIVFIVMDHAEDTGDMQEQTEKNHTEKYIGSEQTDNSSSVAPHNTALRRLNLESTRWSDMKTRLKKQIETALPSHYMPDTFTEVVGGFPFTPHGKLDKKKLLRMGRGDIKLNIDVPRDNESLQHFVEQLWKSHLPAITRNIQSSDNFISLGGDSLAAVKVISIVENTYNNRLPLLLDILLNKNLSFFIQELERYSQSKNTGNLPLDSYSTGVIDPLYLSPSEDRETGKSLQHVTTSILPTAHQTESENLKHGSEDTTEPVMKRSKIVQGSSFVNIGEDGESITSDSIEPVVKTSFCATRQTRARELENSVENYSQDRSVMKPASKLKKIVCRGRTNVKIQHCDMDCNEIEQKANYLPEIDSSSCDKKDAVTNEEVLQSSMRMLKLKERWKFDTQKCVDASPLVVEYQDRTMAFIGSHSHLFSAVDVHTGNSVWSVSLPDRIESSACSSVCGSYVVVGCYNGVIYVIESMTGTLVWQFATGDAVKCSPVLIETTGQVLCGSHDGFLYCLDLNVKQCIWKQNLGGGSVFASPAVDTSLHQAYAASLGGKVTAVCCDNGTIKWTLDLHKPVFSSLRLLGNSVLVCCVDGQIRCISFLGNLKWIFQTKGPIFSTPVVWDSSILFGSHDHYLYCLNCNGQMVWKFQTSSTVYASAFVSQFCLGDGNVELFLTDTNAYETKIDVQNDSVMKHKIASYASSSIQKQDVNDSKAVSDKNISRSVQVLRNCAHVTPGHYRDSTAYLQLTHTCNVTSKSIQNLVTAASSDGNIYIIDLKMGKVWITKKLCGEIFSSPVVLDNQIIVGCRDNFLYCFNISVYNTDQE